MTEKNLKTKLALKIMLLGILIPGLTVLLILKLCKYVESVYGGEIAFFTFIVISFGLVFLIKSYKKSRTKKKFSNLELELTFISTNKIENEIFLDDEKLFDKFLIEDENGNLGIENCKIDTFENFIKLKDFLFQSEFELNQNNFDKQLFDITKYKETCIKVNQLENVYQNWIEISKRENTMDEYGMLLGIISYIERNKDKKYLIIRTEKKHYG
jgi:hypothetical protein